MRVLVTGAARAIGRATCEELMVRGHEVVATARDVAALDDVLATMRLPLDVRDASSVERAVSSAGELDAIVNNAALPGSGPLETLDLEHVTAVLDTNVLGPLRMLQAVAPSWRQRGSGTFVNVSSIQGRVATPLEGAYAASKHALEAISETMHYELRHFGIRTVIIEPGYTAPGMKPGPSRSQDGPYEELHRQWEGTDQVVTGGSGRPGPETVAVAIREAIENLESPLRVPTGPDAAMVLGARASLSDVDFEAAMRSLIGLTW